MADKTRDFRRIGVVMGRFSPLHNGHLRIIEKALEESDYLIILFGSAHQARTYNSPWSDTDRVAMINGVLNKIKGEVQVRYSGIQDHYSDFRWEQEVLARVSGFLESEDDRVTIYGCEKDSSSYYLRSFNWDFEGVEVVDGLHATDIRREAFLKGRAGLEAMGDLMPPSVLAYLLDNWIEGDEYERLTREYKFMERYKEQFKSLKFPPTFVTADSVVVSDDHVLLVRRKEMPGLSLLALPGGFVPQDKTLLDAAMDITSAKAGVTLTREQLKNRIVMDNPERSLRGRTITHAFLFELPAEQARKMKGKKGKGEWRPLSSLPFLQEQMFEDHAQIIQRLIEMNR